MSGLDEDASAAHTTDADADEFRLGGEVENNEFRAGGDERFRAVGLKLQAIRTARVGLEGGDDSFGADVDGGDGAVPGIRNPGLLAVERDVESLGTAADRDHGLFPVAAGWSGANEGECDDAQIRRVHDRERMILLGENERRCFRSRGLNEHVLVSYDVSLLIGSPAGCQHGQEGFHAGQHRG